MNHIFKGDFDTWLGSIVSFRKIMIRNKFSCHFYKKNKTLRFYDDNMIS